jgi:hypothetical protein
MRSFARTTLACLPLSLALLACAEDEPQTYDPEEVIAEAVDFEDNFVRLDADGVLTMHDEMSMTRVQIWANEAGAEVFRTIDINDPDQVVEMPRGAIFVKESYDLDGNPFDAMMVLAKFEEGYNPAANDWFFAMIERDGTVLREGKGQEVEFCRDCHSSMAPNTDHIVGLPADEQAP